jgi:hypothetical protein
MEAMEVQLHQMCGAERSPEKICLSHVGVLCVYVIFVAVALVWFWLVLGIESGTHRVGKHSITGTPSSELEF